MLHRAVAVAARGSGDHTLKVWDLDGTCVATMKGHSGTVYCVFQLADGRVVSGHHDGAVRVWR